MLREFGLALFLASVGIKAGAGFWETVVAGDGLKYVLCGFLITIIPILIVGTIARLKFKFNFFTVMGMIAGTYTDPPALAYANSVCQGEASAIGYSTVYPLSMFLRILAARWSSYSSAERRKDELINTVITPWWGMEWVPSPIIFLVLPENRVIGFVLLPIPPAAR